MRVTQAVQRAGCAVFLGLAAATCGDGTGPGQGQRAYLALAPLMPAQAANLAAFGLAIDALRIVVVRPPADTVADKTVAFAVDLDSISLALSLTLAAPTEVFDVALELRGGGFVLFSATATVEVEAGAPGTNEPLEIGDFVYTGPGAAVTTLLVGPLDSVIRLGDSLRFRVNALADGTPVTQFYVSWSTDNETLAPINAAGVLRAPLQRGLAVVTASTPTGVTGSALVTFIPLPVSVVPIGLIPQNVLPGVPIGPLRVQVLAADDLGVPGIPVTFQPVLGGGSVTDAVVVTDGQGFAETPAMSGLPGTSVFSATVAGVAAPALFNVTVLPTAGGTHLAFAAPPAGGLVGVPIAVVVQVRDAQGNLVPTATDAVTIALGDNPGGATLSGTTRVNAVAGAATFLDLTLNQPGVGYTLVATAPGLTPDTSASFAVLVGVSGRSWTNAAGGSWSNPANWSGGLVPGVNDTVFINLDGTYTVTLDVDASVAVLFVGGATGTQTLSGLGRTLQVDSALQLGPSAVLELTNGVLAGANGTVLNSGIMRLQAVTVAPDLMNFAAATLTARGATTLNGVFTNGINAVTRLEADPFCCVSTLTVATGFTNNGLIELTAINGSGTTATLDVTSGTLVNALGATIAVLAGSGGTRNLHAQLDNQGTLLVAHDASLSEAEADHLNSGAIQLTTGNLSLAQSGTSPTFTTAGTIAVGAGRTLAVSGGTFQYANAVPGGLAGLGTVTFSGTTVALSSSLANDAVTVSFINSTVNGTGTLTNAVGRTLTVQQTAVNALLVNGGLFVARGASSLGGGVTTAPGSTLQLQADPFCCTATLTVATGFTNNGLIELTAINGTGTTATLTVPSGFLVNGAGATIAIRTGSGGARSLQAAVNNQGTVLVEQDVTLSAASADHVNGGTIQLTGGNLTVSQSGITPTFSLTGSILLGAGRTLSVGGGAFTYNSVAPNGLSGPGAASFSGTTVALATDLAPDAFNVSIVNGTMNGPGTFTNAAGHILTVQSTAINAPFVNQGLFVARGASTLGGAVTAGVAGTIRIQGDPFCCTATLSVVSGFTNNGVLELTAVNGTGTTAALAVTAGPLVNAPGAAIAVLPGAGGGRILDAPIENRGTLAIDQPLTLQRAITNFGAVKWMAGDVLAAGGATLDVQPAATFDVTSPGTWSGSGSPTPVIQIQDRAAMNVTTAGATTIQSNMVLNIAGSLNLQSGATLKVAGDFNLLGATGELDGPGTLDVSASPRVTNAGTLRPGGGAPGVLTIVAPPGGWPQGPGSTLVVDVAGTTPGTEYDQVVVLGAVTLGGTINVNRTVAGPPLTEYYPLTATIDIGGVLLPGNLDELSMTLPPPDLLSTPKRVILVQL